MIQSFKELRVGRTFQDVASTNSQGQEEARPVGGSGKFTRVADTQ